MPEMPEMETYRRLLVPRVLNRTIVDAEVNRPKSVNVPVETFRSAVRNKTIVGVERIAKQLVFRLDDGLNLIVHLMLGGWMFFGTEADRPDRTIQVRLRFGAESLYFINLRLGHLRLISEQEVQYIRAKYGPDPFDPSLDDKRLHGLLSKRRTALKTALIDQSILAGIGNCYSDEMCYAAQLLPSRPCPSLSLQECGRLLSAMREVLSDAVRQGGYMDHPLFAGDGLTGGYSCLVYDRAGEACFRCGAPIVVETVLKRKTYYCMNCQR